MRTKNVLKVLKQKITEGAGDVDVIEYATAVTMLEYKLSVLSSLNISVENDSEDSVSFNIFGSNKSITINKAKFREAITITDSPVVEKQGSAHQSLGKDLPSISAEGLSEEEFLEKAVAAIGEVKKTARKTLDKDTFIRVFKYTGDFAKLKNKQMKVEGQKKRCEFFGKEPKAYLKAMQEHIMAEEKAFESTSTMMFDKLCISPECFERTQQELMNDPYVGMELFNMGIAMEHPTSAIPTELSEEKTIELVMKSNDFAFDQFKNNYIAEVSGDPMMMPVLISCIAHDYVNVHHGFDEETFKAALFAHKIYENSKVAEHMQGKQMELLMLASQQNPMLAM